MDRRTFLSGCGAVAAAPAPLAGLARRAGGARRSKDPAPFAPRRAARVGRRDVGELRKAAEAARRTDSRSGGGSPGARSAAELLVTTAAPLLGGPCAPGVEGELYSATAELARVAGWAAFDTGRHRTARGYFRQALYLADAGGDEPLAAYVLTTMGLQATLTGRTAEALDLTTAAGRMCPQAPRVRAFARLVEARAHARGRAPRAAAAALASAEELLGRAADRSGQDPGWIDFFTHSRLAADAAEIHRDLGNPRACFSWDAQAEAMAPDDFTRSVGMRRAVVGSGHLQAGNLEEGLESGRRSLEVLRGVDSSRAREYLGALVAGLGPWEREPEVRAFASEATRLSRAPVSR